MNVVIPFPVIFQYICAWNKRSLNNEINIAKLSKRGRLLAHT